MTPDAFRALCARVWARQAPSSRWLVVSTAPAAMPKKPLTQIDGKATDVADSTRAGEGEDTLMPDATQKRHTPPPPTVGLCLACGVHTTLCAFGHCAACHQERGRQGWRALTAEPAVHLCCGWWGSLSVLPWQCITCNRVVAYERER